jgi:hypothetical protein
MIFDASKAIPIDFKDDYVPRNYVHFRLEMNRGYYLGFRSE